MFQTNYTPPEVILNTSYSNKSDIWGLGCSLFEMINLSKLFESNKSSQLILKILYSDYNDLHDIQIDNIFNVDNSTINNIVEIIKSMIIKNVQSRHSIYEIINCINVKELNFTLKFNFDSELEYNNKKYLQLNKENEYNKLKNETLDSFNNSNKKLDNYFNYTNTDNSTNIYHKTLNFINLKKSINKTKKKNYSKFVNLKHYNNEAYRSISVIENLKKHSMLIKPKNKFIKGKINLNKQTKFKICNNNITDNIDSFLLKSKEQINVINCNKSILANNNNNTISSKYNSLYKKVASNKITYNNNVFYNLKLIYEPKYKIKTNYKNNKLNKVESINNNNDKLNKIQPIKESSKKLKILEYSVDNSNNINTENKIKSDNYYYNLFNNNNNISDNKNDNSQISVKVSITEEAAPSNKKNIVNSNYTINSSNNNYSSVRKNIINKLCNIFSIDYENFNSIESNILYNNKLKNKDNKLFVNTYNEHKYKDKYNKLDKSLFKTYHVSSKNISYILKKRQYFNTIYNKHI